MCPYNSESDRKYQSDPTFKAVVDTMLALLGQYQVTPDELRRASIMAAVEFENRRIKPMYYPNAAVSSLMEWAYESVRSGRIRSDKPNFTELERMKQHIFISKGAFRICAKCNLSDVYINSFNAKCNGGAR